MRLPACRWFLLASLTLLCACEARDFGGVKTPTDELHFPISVRPLPGHAYALVSSANFDLEYRSGALSILDVQHNTILKGDGFGVEIGNFAGDIALLIRDGIATDAYVPTREGDAVYHIDISYEDGVPRLSCSEDGGSVCDGDHVLTDVGNDSIGNDPFGAIVFHEPLLNEDLLLVTELGDGGVDIWRLDDTGSPEALGRLDLEAPGMMSPVYLPQTGRLLIPNRFYNAITTFEIDYTADPLEVRSRRDLSLPIGMASGDYYRSVVAIGSMIYIADRNSDRVVVLDALSEAFTGTLPAIQGVTGIARSSDDLLIATSFDHRRLAVIDLQSESVLAVIGLTRRPYGIAIVEPPGADIHRAYFSMFTEDRLGVMELDPLSDRFLDVIAYIQ
jgi:hypothetical protein